MPIPYKASKFRNLHFAEYTNGKGETKEGCFFTLMGIPFQMRFGKDRSGNKLIVERVLSGEYKMCTSSIQMKDGKMFLLLCADIPQKEVKLDEKKTLYAILGVMNPILCTKDVAVAQTYMDYVGKLKEADEGVTPKSLQKKFMEIGTAEEFLYRRIQIQAAVRRCQINNRYTVGGKGHKRKCQALDRWHEKEKNYIDTKLHLYSLILVDLAVKHGCGKLMLLNQKPREDKAKEDNTKGKPLVLRNWSYYGFKDKIGYKCKMVGIKLEQDKDTTDDTDETE